MVRLQTEVTVAQALLAEPDAIAARIEPVAHILATPWMADMNYRAGQVLAYEGQYYISAMAHMSQEDNPPGEVTIEQAAVRSFGITPATTTPMLYLPVAPKTTEEGI